MKKQVTEKEAAGKNYLFVRLNRARKNRGQKTPKIQIRPFKYVKELFKYKFKIKIVKLDCWFVGKLEGTGLRFWFCKRSTLIFWLFLPPSPRKKKQKQQTNFPICLLSSKIPLRHFCPLSFLPFLENAPSTKKRPKKSFCGFKQDCEFIFSEKTKKSKFF